MKRTFLVTTTPTGSPRCSKCRTPLINPLFPFTLPDFCPNCKRELDYSVYMTKAKLNEIKRKDKTK